MPVFCYAIPIAALLFFGCSPCELRQRPRSIPEEVITQALEENTESVEFTSCTPECWWELFQDEQLTSFISLALEQNPSLQQAYAKILLASANADRVRSTLSPSIFWAADVSRQKLSETGLIPFIQSPTPNLPSPAPPQLAATGGAAGIPVYFTQTETEFNFSYDFDLWRKKRNTWSAALSEVQARIADEAFARLELAIAIAQTYYQLQIDYQRLHIANKLVELNDNFVELTHDRLKGNLDQAGSLQTAKTNLSSAKQNALQKQASIDVAENMLRSYLAGSFNEAIFVRPIEKKPLPYVPVPCDLPMRLIAKRPDIVAQLWMIESAGKQIEVAIAGFYPDVNINALFGLQTIHINKLLQWPSVFYNVDPAISLPIFDGGRLSANLLASEINYDLAIAEYDSKIINAVREVLDGLAVLHSNRQQLAEYKIKLQEQEKLFQLIKLKAENNLASNLDTIISESELLNVQDQELIALGQAYQAVLLLIKAIGGGYETCYTQG